ncbi:unnamed protein product [Sympodiomycopsis kandeliae]
MSTPASTIISLIFAPLYIIIAILAVINVFNHGAGRRRAFILLSLFGSIRAAGDILLAYAYFSKTTNTSIYIAGFVCSGLGYSFLLTSAVSFYERVCPRPEGLSLRQRLLRLDSFLYYLPIVAVALVASGYSNSSALSDTQTFQGSSASNGSNAIHLDVRVEVGQVIFMAATLIFAVMIFLACYKGYGRAAEQSSEDRLEASLLLKTIVAVVPFLCIRSIYIAAAALDSHPLGFEIISRVICFYVMDVVSALILLIGGGFLVHRARKGAVPKVLVREDEENKPASTGGYAPSYSASGATPSMPFAESHGSEQYKSGSA